MNPNLRIFFRRSVYVVVFAAFAVGLYFGLANFTAINFSVIGEYSMYALMGFMMVLMFGLIGGVILRTVWGSIMNRADTIVLCCPDKQSEGVHIIASHYNPGGESSEGFSDYLHYYLTEHGKLYLSKKVQKDGSDITKSLEHLSHQTRLQLNPDQERGVRIGAHTDGDDNGTDVIIALKNAEVHFHGYEAWIDYGFKIHYTVQRKIKWKVRI